MNDIEDREAFLLSELKKGCWKGDLKNEVDAKIAEASFQKGLVDLNPAFWARQKPKWTGPLD